MKKYEISESIGLALLTASIMGGGIGALYGMKLMLEASFGLLPYGIYLAFISHIYGIMSDDRRAQIVFMIISIPFCATLAIGFTRYLIMNPLP